jgi:hypothetical protein
MSVILTPISAAARARLERSELEMAEMAETTDAQA